MFRPGKIVCLLAALFVGLTLAAQPTRVKGRVVEKGTGEGIPFCGVYFQGTTIGITSDLDGYFTIETRDTSARVLTAQMIGYDTRTFEVTPGTFAEVTFELPLIIDKLDAAVVRPDNTYMRWILSQIDAHRHIHNPEKRKEYQCDLYSKIELDLTNAEDQIRSKVFRKNFGFVFEYMDTSVVSGQPYLPVMISETRAHRYHTRGPDLDKEVIEASRVSGLNDENAVSQFTGSLHLRANFYNSFINAFNVDIPSPLAAGGEFYYNYYLIDSLQVDGRKTWKIRFHPKKANPAPTFDGEMSIDAEDFALREMHTRLDKKSNVNWIRDLVIDVENQRVGDSAWFYKEDRLYVDFSVTQSDSSKMMSFIGRRQIDYSNPEFSRPSRKELEAMGESVMVRKDAGTKDEEYWDSVRPYELSDREKGIYQMVEQVKSVPLYNNIATVITTFIKGYYNFDKIGIGPYYKLASFNAVEGFRPQFGVRTTSEFSKFMRLGGYVAYGTKDHDFKGGATAEFMFSNQPTEKLTLEAKRDYEQLGKSRGSLSESNILSSVLTKSGGGHLRSFVNEFSATYEKEFSPGVNNSFGVEFKRIFGNDMVPLVKPDGTVITSVGANQLRYHLRLSWDETVTRGAFDKYYVHTKYPIIDLDLVGSQKGIGHYDYTFLRAEGSLQWRVPAAPLGHGKLYVNAGHIFGNVPYPMLKLHEGNDTYFLDRSAYACMDFFEFASDTWATLSYEHNFGGFFLGAIPLLKRMQLREVATVKVAYGTISEHNNGILGNPDMREATLLFPAGMTSLNKPYVEVGAGVSNILRVIRVDAFWRLTHRTRIINGAEQKVPHRFSVNVGVELAF